MACWAPVTAAVGVVPSSMEKTFCRRAHFLDAQFSGLRLASPLGKGVRASRGATPRVRAAGAATAVAVPVVAPDGARTMDAEINLRVARPETARAVVHRGVIAELQNRRRGTASTLTRAEVRGGGRKPYKQKGTGNARRGSQRTPLRPGGGVVFGPKPVDWRIKINKKEKQLAISTALQSAAADALVVDELDQISTPKTKDFIAALGRWGVDVTRRSLIFTTAVSRELDLSSRNLKTVKILTPRSLNLYDVLRADRLLFTKGGLDYLNERYGAAMGDFEPEAEEDDGEDIDVEASVQDIE